MPEAPFRDLTSALKDAIGKLEEFSRGDSHKHVSTPLQKAISLFRSLIIDKKWRHQNAADQGEVLKAIEVVNRERLFIQKLRTGTFAEKNLADSFTKGIDAYNNSRDQHIQDKAQRNGRLSEFFFSRPHRKIHKELPKIDLPQESSVEYHYPERTASSINDGKVFAFKTNPSSVKLSKQSIELFQMKALALLERYGIASNPEARHIVKNAPIHANVENNTRHCTLAQTLTLFPGQTVVVIGTSELDPKMQTISRLFPETFSISLESRQTGFPHPSQRAGWTLANQLLPESPQRLDLLGHLGSFFRRKKKATADLLPHGNLIGKAKKLLKLKKQAFEDNKKELIALHKELADALVYASPACSAKSHAQGIAPDFFYALQNHAQPFDYLAETYQTIRDTFIAKPCQIFLDNCLKSLSSPGMAPDQSCEALDQLFENAQCVCRNDLLVRLRTAEKTWEQNQLEYIDAMGLIIANAVKQIILQYFSEDLLFKPPVLNLFERKIQTAAYRHVEDFLAELNMDLTLDGISSKNEIYLVMKREMNWDIELLQNGSSLIISDQLADYFEKRYWPGGYILP